MDYITVPGLFPTRRLSSVESNLLSASASMSIGRDIRADDLEGRLVQFAIDIVKLVGELPQNFQARHIATQLLRSGTAAAPNYAEARAPKAAPISSTN